MEAFTPKITKLSPNTKDQEISHQLLTLRTSEENITSQNVSLANVTKFYQYPIIISLKTHESINLQTVVFLSS